MLFRSGHEASPTQFSLMLLAYGACGFLGNAWVSRHIDRLGAERAMLLALGLIATGMVLVNFAHAYTWMVLAMLPWGLGAFASNSAQQARLVGLAPVLAPASVALNTSAMYMGQALGATVGGWLLLEKGLLVLPGFGCLGVFAAMLLSIWASRVTLRHPVDTTT